MLYPRSKTRQLHGQSHGEHCNVRIDDITATVAQVSAAQAAGGVTAFARPREQPRRVDLAELAELDAAMESGSEGDLEDDFLLTATQVCEAWAGP